MSLASVEDACSRLLETALADPSDIFHKAATVVKLIKELCDDVSDKDQKDARAKLAEIVRCSKAVAAEGNTVAKIQLLANLNQYTSQLLELVRNICHTKPNDNAAKLAQLHRTQMTEVCAVEAGDEEEASAPLSPAPTDTPAAAAQGNAPAAAAPREESGINSQLSILLGHMREMRTAVLDWNVAGFVGSTTSLIRSIPNFLKQADGKLENSEDLKSLRQKIAGSCKTLTNYARAVAKAPQERRVAPQIVDEVTAMENRVKQFTDVLQREESPAGGSALVNYQKLQQLVIRHEEVRITDEPPQDAPELQNTYGNVKTTLNSLITAFDGGDEAVVRQNIELTVIVTCRLLVVADCIAPELPMRSQCHRFLHSLLTSAAPYHEPASKPSHTEDIAFSTQGMRAATRGLSRSVDTLCTMCLKHLTDPEAIKPMNLPSSTTTMFPETESYSRQNSAADEAERPGNGDDTPKHQKIIVHMCSGSAFDMQYQREISKGEHFIFETLPLDVTIDSIKAIMSQRTDIPFLKQEIVHSNQVLPNATIISTLDVTESDPLYLFDIRESGTQRDLFKDSPADVPAVEPEQPGHRGSAGKRASSGNIKKKFELKPGDLKMDEDERLRLLQLVKEGKLSVEDVMSSVKGAPSASATLAVEASKVGGRSEDAEPIGYMNISRSNSGVVEITSSAPDGSIIQEGVLLKEGYNRKSWKKRWFVLRHDSLSYFKSPEDKSPLGTLKLANFASCVYQDCDRRPFAFTMQPKAANGRSYFFAAETLTDQKRWLHAIDDHIPGRRTLSQKWSLLQDLIGQLMQKGATKEGIFRIPGNAGQVKRFIQAFDTTTPVDLDAVLNPHTLAGYLKRLFLDEKLEPLVPCSAQSLLDEAFGQSDSEVDRLKALDSTMMLVTNQESVVLQALLRLFAMVCKNGDQTQMTSDQLGQIFGRLLLQSMSEARSAVALEYLIEQAMDRLDA